MAAKTTSEDPLAPFIRLSPSVYLQETSVVSDNRRECPKTIVLAFWMNAPPRALTKYVAEYARLAPSARIIFIRSSTSDFLLNATVRAQQARVAPAVEKIQVASATTEEPVFLHMFSNGGASTTAHLLAAYRRMTGKSLRISSMIIDSAPGTLAFRASVKAFSFALPRMWILRFMGKILLYTVLIASWLVRKLTRRPDVISLAREAINDNRLIDGPDSNKNMQRRCYIYSDADDLIDWRDVENHAADAEAKGWVVQKVIFQGTPHVGHMRADSERYWSIVRTYLETVP